MFSDKATLNTHATRRAGLLFLPLIRLFAPLPPGQHSIMRVLHCTAYNAAVKTCNPASSLPRHPGAGGKDALPALLSSVTSDTCIGTFFRAAFREGIVFSSLTDRMHSISHRGWGKASFQPSQPQKLVNVGALYTANSEWFRRYKTRTRNY